MAADLRVGFVGLGSQGGGMAHAVAAAGLPLTVWARRPEVLAEFTDAGARAANDLRALAEASDVVGVCVTADADVEQVVVEGLLPGLRGGAIVAIHSTVHPETCRRLAGRLARAGVDVLDAPVSGGGEVARAGELAVMVGGDEAVFERCRPVFETFGGLVRRVGPLGSGQLCKILNNLAFTAQLALGVQVLERGRALGLEAGPLRELLLASSSRSLALQALPVLEQPAAAAAFRNLVKDEGLFAELARAAGLGPGELEAAAGAGARAVTAALERSE